MLVQLLRTSIVGTANAAKQSRRGRTKTITRTVAIAQPAWVAVADNRVHPGRARAGRPSRPTYGTKTKTAPA